MSGSDASAAVEHFFAAMQTGAAGEDAMMALFHPDAVYIEPFSGKRRVHRGKAAVRAAFVEGWCQPLPELRIVVDHVDIDGAVVDVHWTCHSPAIPGGAVLGVNRFRCYIKAHAAHVTFGIWQGQDFRALSAASRLGLLSHRRLLMKITLGFRSGARVLPSGRITARAGRVLQTGQHRDDARLRVLEIATLHEISKEPNTSGGEYP